MEKSPVDLAARHILPTLALCVFVNIVDRTNVGIAALNMRADIGLSASAYGMGAGLFYIGFFFAGVPANLLLARIGARRWIAALLVAWGLIAIATGFISDAGSFYAVRLALGIAEAGFVPAIVYYLAQWFDRRAMSKVMGLMIAMMPASLAIGAPLTTGLLMAVDWRWLFIIEGAPAFLVAILVLKSLPERIDDVPWLSDDQKKALSARLMADGAHRQAGSWRDALTHPQVLLLSLQYFCIGLSSQAIIFWFPQIIRSTGMSTLESGLFSTVPWVLAALLTPLWAWHSASTNERYWHAILPCLASGAITIAGALLLDDSALSGLWLLSLGVALSSMASASYWAIPRVHVFGAAAAAAGALTNSFGNLAGFVAPVAVGISKDMTGEFRLVLILLAMPAFLAALCSTFAGRMADPVDRRSIP
ncbi:MFS transporter [Sphingobium sp. SA916]|uniref:MFS transporter n=1 Tax=Sphingobium sp. SA916 TaxID=1851207 RepID=UPI000CB232AE|nr:MFS transporter [Sphingobium sp. SA916]PNQ00358.1 hypothetical protein A8G00_17540 [Sphingobium sp. SA916]